MRGRRRWLSTSREERSQKDPLTARPPELRGNKLLLLEPHSLRHRRGRSGKRNQTHVQEPPRRF